MEKIETMVEKNKLKLEKNEMRKEISFSNKRKGTKRSQEIIGKKLIIRKKD